MADTKTRPNRAGGYAVQGFIEQWFIAGALRLRRSAVHSNVQGFIEQWFIAGVHRA